MILRGSCTSLFLVVAVLIATFGSATSYRHSREEELIDEERAWSEFKEFREWKKSRNDWRRDAESIRDHLPEDQARKLVDPPPIDQPALMGRYIVNQAEWASVATISSRKDVATFPIANVISISDGPLGNGTGIIYMFLTPLDFTAQDVAKDPRASLSMTLAQGDYCKEKGMDPMDPRCARILLTGIITQVKPDSPELEVAKNAVFGRHPWLEHMPPDHEFFFAKLKIASIVVLDTFGGPKYVSVEDYLHPPNPKEIPSYRRRYHPKLKNLSHGNDDYPEQKYAFRV